MHELLASSFLNLYAQSRENLLFAYIQTTKHISVFLFLKSDQSFVVAAGIVYFILPLVFSISDSSRLVTLLTPSF